MDTLFKTYGFNINEKKKLLFNNYYNDLVEKNKVMNLTAITNKNEVIVKHFLDSVLPLNFIKDNSKVLDIGSGAGFPGIPLKIMNNTLDVTLLDSLNKRINFLNEEIHKLNLLNIKAIHARAEEYVNVSRETFDYVVSRAVAKLNTLLEYCLPYVKMGGYFIAYKSVGAEEEIEISRKALKILGGQVEKVKKLNVEGLDRTLIYIKKVAVTPKKYPRGQNKPKNEPIL